MEADPQFASGARAGAEAGARPRVLDKRSRYSNQYWLLRRHRHQYRHEAPVKDGRSYRANTESTLGSAMEEALHPVAARFRVRGFLQPWRQYAGVVVVVVLVMDERDGH